MANLHPRFQAWIDPVVRRMPAWVATPARVLLQGAARWIEADGAELGASIAFYTMFAIAPLMIITVAIAGAVFGEEAARGQLVAQFEGLLGRPAAQVIESMIASTVLDRHGPLATVLGIFTIFVGTTGVFAELRRALNALSNVREEPTLFKALLRPRLVAVAMVLGLGFLAIASLILSAVLAGVSGYVARRYPGLEVALAFLDIGFSIAMMGIAFAALLRWMPDRPASPRGVWIGALTAATLFAAGKSLIGLYLGRASIASSFGAAASFVVILLWIWYSTQILLYGAAVGFSWDARRGARKAEPARDPEGETAYLMSRH